MTAEILQLPAATVPTAGRQRKPFALVPNKGTVRLPIYRDKDGRFSIHWYEGNQRKRTRRATFEAAKTLAEDKAKAVVNGKLYLASMTDRDRATLQRVQEILLPTGKSPELVAAEYAESWLMLRQSAIDAPTQLPSFQEVFRFYLTHASRKIAPKLIPDLVDEFMAARRANTFGRKAAGVRWLTTLESQLERFKAHFRIPISELNAEKLNAWLYSLKMKKPGSKDVLVPITGETIKGYRTAISGLIGFAKFRGYLDTKWDDLDRVHIPPRGKINKPVLTPDELVRLLAVTPGKMVPFICLAAFAGIRHEEMNGKKSVLEWRNIDFKNQVIYVPEDVAKNVSTKENDRVVKMPDNLVAWLAPYSRPSGPICQVANTSNAIFRLKRKAGIKAGKNETRNVLRKSWASYSDALKSKDEDISAQAGHSQAIGKRNYIRAQLESEAQRWFAIRPTSADILPLEFAIK